MNTLKIIMSPNYKAEREYVCHVLFHEFLGLSYEILFEEQTLAYQIQYNNASITLPDVLFSTRKDHWLHPESFPVTPLQNIVVHYEGAYCSDLPVLYGIPKSKNEKYASEVDIFGCVFFLLTRYEEANAVLDDKFERYDFKHSILFKEKLLNRPLVNEYVELFKNLLKGMFPEIVFKKHNYSFSLSHDVDVPITFNLGWADVVKKGVGDILYRRSVKLFFKRCVGKINNFITGSYSLDPNNNFHFLMDVADKNGIKSIFNFIPLPGDTPFDSRYNLSDTFIQKLLTDINKRGFEVGFHPSYFSFKDYKRTKSELDTLNKTLQALGIQPIQRGRHHYLRWANPITWSIWSALGLKEDSSVGYDGMNGFRSGCCFKYSVFDLKEREHLRLVEEPLIVMDINNSVHNNKNNINSEALKYMSICKFFGGNFTLLYHNNYVISDNQKQKFAALVKSCAH